MENKDLTSNQYYSLSELFSKENRKIIIPDFQRDYCWGDKTHGEDNNKDIVGGFLDTLIEEFTSNNGDVLLGKIDVYESPKNHIYLTDGQQRLTTLYFIIGMLYRKEQDDDLKKKIKSCLIPDDKEPYLQYAVRESTVFFLRDLVNDFFIKETPLNVSDIQKQPWYFSEYDSDPSISSMLTALEIIDRKLNSNMDIDLAKFFGFVINNVKIQYYDVKDKKHGEESFVVINTTGKSLTISENIKPLLLGNIKDPAFAQQWEERETWFWKQRDKQKENISDNGINDFLTWCFQIIDKQDNIEIIKKAKTILKPKYNQSYIEKEQSCLEIQSCLEKIQSYFKALKQLIVFLNDDKFQTQLKFINDKKEVKSIVDIRNLTKEKQKNILLPLLLYISKFEINYDNCYQFLRRLRKNYFDHEWKERRENYTDWRYVLQIVEKSNIEKILEFDNKNFTQIGNIPLPKPLWFNDEEKQKRQLSEHKQLLEIWEDYIDFMGDLSPLFKIVENNNDIEILKNYFDTYKSIQIDNFTFTDEISVKNAYRLHHYIVYGKFVHGSVSGYGYCMLERSNVKLFLLKGFNEIWHRFYQENDILDFFNKKIKAFFKDDIVKDQDLNDILYDTSLIGHYKRVQLWSIIEFLYSENELNFKHNICQFWGYPNLIKIESETNNYSIGNLLLGTSYYNNKSGWVDFTKYPLMKLLSKNRDIFPIEQINLRTLEIKKKLIDFIN